MKNRLPGILFLSAVFAGVVSGSALAQESPKVRVGFFPNITHAQAMVGQADGEFDQAFGAGTLEWTSFNAGPSVIEAMFAGHLDIAYIGPSPAVNGYLKSGGDALKIVAGAAAGGAALVVRDDVKIQSPSDFHQKKIASPQFGNTQDVALRSWLASQNLKLREKGGDVDVLPLANADQLTLFMKKEIDASWSVEPWVSIFLKKGGAHVYLEESSLWADGKYATTVVIVRKKFLEEHPDLVKKFVDTNARITDWINAHPDDAKTLLNQQFEKVMHKKIDPDILNAAWKRVQFTTDPMKASVTAQAENAYKVGFLKKKPDLKGLF